MLHFLLVHGENGSIKDPCHKARQSKSARRQSNDAVESREHVDSAEHVWPCQDCDNLDDGCGCGWDVGTNQTSTDCEIPVMFPLLMRWRSQDLVMPILEHTHIVSQAENTMEKVFSTENERKNENKSLKLPNYLCVPSSCSPPT
jgi:hypothetical protein